MIFRFINHTLVSHLMQWWKLSIQQGHNIFSIVFFYTILKRKLQHITIFYILHIIFTSSFYSKRKINRWDLSADIVGSWKCFFQSGENRYWINAVWKTWGCEGAGPIVVGPSASPFMDWPFSYYRLRWSNNIQSITL